MRRLQHIARARHRAGFDGGEFVTAVLVGRHPAEPDELAVQRLVLGVFRMGVLPSALACQNSSRASGIGLPRSEEHTYELQSLMLISYAVFCLKKKNTTHTHQKEQEHVQ